MFRLTRVAVCTLVLVTVTGCTSGKKKPSASATPAPPVTESASDSPAAAESPSGFVSETPSAGATSSPAPTPSSSAVSTPSVGPTATASATATATADPTTPPNVSSAPATVAPVDEAQLAAARALLVTGPQLGADWTHEPGDEPELGDVCGTATAAQRDRLLDVSWELVSQNVEGAARHGISRYKPGGATTAARAILDLLAQCKNVTHDFDGDSAVVTATLQTPNMATFTITFASGSVNFGGMAVTHKGDYLSISTSYAVSTAIAAEIAGALDLRAQRKFVDAGIK